MLAYAVSIGMGGVMIYGNTTDLHDGSYKVIPYSNVWAKYLRFKISALKYFLVIQINGTPVCYDSPGQQIVY